MKTLVIYGCGYSLNELSETQWDELRQYDSIGVNWFVFQRWVKPTYMLVGDIRHDKKEPKVGHTMAEAYEKYIEQAKDPCYDDTIFLVRPYQMEYVRGMEREKVEWEWDPLWSKNCITTAFHWAHLNGYASVLTVGVDLYDYRYFFLGKEQQRMYGMKDDSGWRTKSRVGGKHPALRKFKNWFKDCKTDLKIYCYNPKSLLLDMPGVLSWSSK